MTALARDIYYDEIMEKGWEPSVPSRTSVSKYDGMKLNWSFAKSHLGISKPIRLASKYVKAKKPVGIEVIKEEDTFIAQNERLHIFASGESVNAAVKDFLQQLVYFYEHYRGLSVDELTGDAIVLKQIYESEFEETLIASS